MKVIFLGTPDFAVGILEALNASSHEVTAVVSQPDRAKDRKGKFLPTPVKKRAQELGLKVFQFEKISIEGIDALKSLKSDIMVTAAYGQILSREVLSVTPRGVVNVHASLLPKYRGSAPIQWAIINGEEETGVTIMQTAVGVDDGDILSAQRTPIMKGENAGQLFERLKDMGARLLVRTLDELQAGSVKPVPQDPSMATRCRMLKKEDGHINFCESRTNIINRINGVTPFPGAYCFYEGAYIKIGSALICQDGINMPDRLVCGRVSVENNRILVDCADGRVSIETLQPAGKKMMSAREYLKGHGFASGAVLS